MLANTAGTASPSCQLGGGCFLLRLSHLWRILCHSSITNMVKPLCKPLPPPYLADLPTTTAPLQRNVGTTGGHHSTTSRGESSDMELTVTGECPGQGYSSLLQEKTKAGSLLFHSKIRHLCCI